MSGRKTWTITVTGGEAFMENAVQALRFQAAQYHVGSPTNLVFDRLASACERAKECPAPEHDERRAG